MSEKGSFGAPPNVGHKDGSTAHQSEPYVYVPSANQHVTSDDSDPIVKGFEFNTESIRRGFIRKVYTILSVMLLCTLTCVMLFVHHDASREFAFHNRWLFIVALVAVLVTIISLSCCEGVRRTAPTNMIFLSIFTIAESVMVGYSTLQYDPEVVMLAVGVTAVVVIALTVFAFQTKWDFTMMGGILFVALWLMIVVSLIMMFTRSQTAHTILAGFGALLFCAYLIYDTQMIMGGNHKYSLSPEEYILGAITLFLDIINIFLYILRILGAASKN